ncbi:RNA pyrophosphohydrolase [Natronospirillum operosum]|uniref:RNA pyrophosphohydrolase n=1 Tax=Natronospirillum operosum TaxID=2759953 RepID=A0A4Z0W8K3_9GAMM|nr:RNA pyrophosphohydrolase [Natronospirillum operosum]TGG91378.1 RNA pyrophosphohydrolase [Natronospirillum operosum]
MIDVDGYRPNVGIILANDAGQVLWARRIGQDAWQFPQGGIGSRETPLDAMYRELREEIGLGREDVDIIACTCGWLKYRLPRRMVRQRRMPVCIGQKQKWFLLRMRGDDSRVALDHSDTPEFDGWQWVSYWYPLAHVVPFKKQVYRQALTELAPRLTKALQGQSIQHADHAQADRTGSY